MMLMSHAKGIGSCWIGSVKKSRVKELLKIPEHLSIYSILALGYPDEDPVIQELAISEPEVYIDTSGKVVVQKKIFESIISVNEFKGDLL